MSNQRVTSRVRHREQGQTIVLVALSIVTLLAMAALAIDVVTLYVARSEMQRAADAAALVGAKAFVDSGVTTDPTNTNLQTLAQNMANAGINAIVQQNKVAGVAPVLVGTPTFDFTTRPGNPQVTVTVQRTDLPTFFARIWGTRLAAVTASATAEAYNPSNWQTTTGISVAPKCVKPLLIPNLDPNRAGAPFITVATGVVAPGVVGEGPFTLKDACPNGSATCGPPVPTPTAGQYLPAKTEPDPTKDLCPSCKGSSDIEQSIECCDFIVYSCGGTPATPNATVDTTISGNTSQQDIRNGVQCLIHDPSQDTLDTTNFLSNSGPMQITAGSGPLAGKLVTTSSSIATLPIFDTASLNAATGQVTVVGFLQVFIDPQATALPGNADIPVTILNVVGCGNTAGTTAVSGGGASAIPVRLIHQ
jgi:Flp pilus assembly protein TadG